MNGRILLFKGTSQYDVLRHFTDDLGAAFRALGREVLILDLASNKYNVQVVQDAFSKECDFVCGYNLNGHDLGLGHEGIKFLRDIGIPYIGILVDSPLYLFLKFRDISTIGMPDNFLITCIDKNHLEILEHYGKVGLSTFLPHAGSYAQGIGECKDMVSRSKDVFFCGTYSKPNISWTQHPLSSLLNDVAEMMLGAENIQVYDALQQVLRMKNYVLSPEFFRQILDVVVHVDIYVRNVWRARMLTELANAGIKVSLYGNGWDQLPCTKSFDVHKSVDFVECLQIMEDAKIVLNFTSFFSHGSHERVFSAMLNGAVALTDTNGYWKEQFVEDKEIVTYSIIQQNELPEKINTLLSDLPRLDAIAQAGQKKAEQFHTWEVRAQEIIKLVQMMDGIRSIKA